jgi:hypothetical protein
MKQILLFLLLGFACVVKAQNKPDVKDCKLIDLYMPNKDKVKGFIANSSFGKMTMYKVNGTLNGYYTVKGVFEVLQNNNNMIDLRIDSVRFSCADNTSITVKVTGTGHTRNSSESLKPTFETVKFLFALEPGAKRDLFVKSTITGFIVFAEKDGQYNEIFTPKQQAFLARNIICLENQ